METSAPARIEIATFWFGPTPSDKVALLACALLGGDPEDEGSLCAMLAAQSLRLCREIPAPWIHWREGRPSETSGWARLIHRQIFLAGHESFHMSFGFAERFCHQAALNGLTASACAPFWASHESSLELSGWMPSLARSHAEKAQLDFELGTHKQSVNHSKARL